MRKNMSGMITIAVMCTLIVSIYLAFSGRWIAADINQWQATIVGNNKYYPTLTMACLFVPPAMVLLFIKFFLEGRFTQKRNPKVKS